MDTSGTLSSLFLIFIFNGFSTTGGSSVPTQLCKFRDSVSNGATICVNIGTITFRLNSLLIDPSKSSQLSSQTERRHM